ncbi:hypothetical protein AGMMS49975_04160 [Clostridia bacterium]|nr:hypothetical protein AGMMS49975_04160 [Clostridia bacterium]
MPTETLTAEYAETTASIIEERPDTPYNELTLDEKLIRLIKLRNIPVIEVDLDENGNIFVDKDKDPDLYDWAVNG